MPIPIVIAALAAGGTLVAHSGGGFIVTSAAGSYVAGTYISTATVASLLSSSAIMLGAGTVIAVAPGAPPAIAGMRRSAAHCSLSHQVPTSTGSISSAPAWVTSMAASTRCFGRDAMGYARGQVYEMRNMIDTAVHGAEIRFTDSQARVLQQLLLRSPSVAGA